MLTSIHTPDDLENPNQTETPLSPRHINKLPIELLIIEDEDCVLTALSRMFKNSFKSVLTATNTADGEQIIMNTKSPLLIVSDLDQLPTGYTIAERTYPHRETYQMPFLIYTGGEAKQPGPQLIELGIIENILHKGENPKILKASVHQIGQRVVAQLAQATKTTK